MTAFITAALIWPLLLCFLLRGCIGPSRERWSRAIAFRPTESMSPEQLFSCLLGGNCALLMRDNFNQLASSLSERRIHKLLHEHWAIDSREDCRHVIHSRLDGLGRMSPAEKRAIAAWLLREQVDSSEYAALEDTCLFLAQRARVAQVDELRRDHLSVLAWDIQQLACLVRFAHSVGYLSRPRARDILQLLSTRARSRYSSWKDYSLAALQGLGIRGSLEIFDHREWARFARTHDVLLNPHQSPTRHAAYWHGRAESSSPVRERAAFGGGLLPSDGQVITP